MEAMSFDDYKQEVRKDAEAYIDKHVSQYDYFNDIMEDMMDDKDVTGSPDGKLGAATAAEAISTLVNDRNFTEKQFPYMMDRELDDRGVPSYVDVDIRKFFLKIQWCDLHDYFEEKKK